MLISAKSYFFKISALTASREDKFFLRIRLANGVLKTTRRHRMDDLNAAVVDTLRRFGIRPRRCLDVAVSSGISTLEWLDAMNEAGFFPSMTGTDLSLCARLLEPLRAYSVLVDSAGNPLQHSLLGFGVRPWSRRRDYVTGQILIIGLCNWLYRRLVLASTSPVKDAQDVMLLCADARGRSDIHFAQSDILAAPSCDFARKYDIARCANLLNYVYFSDQQLRRGLQNLKACLAGAGSFLVINRTLENGENHGTVFRLDENMSFRAVARIGQGSEIEQIVLAS